MVTTTHVVEPQYPGAVETLVNLCDCWNSKTLYEKRKEIIEISGSVSKCHEHCCRFLAACGSLTNDTYRIAEQCTDHGKISRYATRFASREFRPKNGPGKELVRFLSAVTNQGVLTFTQTAQDLCSRIYLIEDEYGASSKLLLHALRQAALESGYNVISCFCPLSPFDKLEHLLIPELSLGFMTSNPFHPLDIEPYRVIHARRFTDMELLSQRKKRLAFNRKAANQMLEQAIRLLMEAKEKHDKLECCYIAAMNFDLVNQKTEDTILQMKDSVWKE